MKRILCGLLAVIVVLTTVVPVMAAEGESSVTPRYSYIQSLHASLSINSIGVASCDAAAVAYGGDSVRLSSALQKYTGSSWTTVKAWSTTAARTAGLSKNYAVPKGYTYRLRVTCTVYNASGTMIESGTLYSNQVVY